MSEGEIVRHPASGNALVRESYVKIGIDITHLLWKYRTGVQNYYHGLIENLPSVLLDNKDAEVWLIDRTTDEIHDFGFSPNERLRLHRARPRYFIPTFQRSANVPVAGRVFRSWNWRVQGLRNRVAHRRVTRLVDQLDVLHVWNWDIRT